jgi:hypothetical protein
MTPEIQMALVGVAVLVIGALGNMLVAALNRFTDSFIVNNATKRAEAIAESAISDATEGEPADEGGTIAAVADYLQSSVGETIAKRGGSVPSMAAAIALGVIARAAKR